MFIIYLLHKFLKIILLKLVYHSIQNFKNTTFSGKFSVKFKAEFRMTILDNGTPGNQNQMENKKFQLKIDIKIRNKTIIPKKRITQVSIRSKDYHRTLSG